MELTDDERERIRPLIRAVEKHALFVMRSPDPIPKAKWAAWNLEVKEDIHTIALEAALLMAEEVAALPCLSPATTCWMEMPNIREEARRTHMCEVHDARERAAAIRQELGRPQRGTE